jgi:hypothetical protein
MLSHRKKGGFLDEITYILDSRVPHLDSGICGYGNDAFKRFRRYHQCQSLFPSPQAASPLEEGPSSFQCQSVR